MDMETPGPFQNKWMKALSALMLFLATLFLAKQRNASVNRHHNLRTLHLSGAYYWVLHSSQTIELSHAQLPGVLFRS